MYSTTCHATPHRDADLDIKALVPLLARRDFDHVRYRPQSFPSRHRSLPKLNHLGFTCCSSFQPGDFPNALTFGSGDALRLAEELNDIEGTPVYDIITREM